MKKFIFLFFVLLIPGFFYFLLGNNKEPLKLENPSLEVLSDTNIQKEIAKLEEEAPGQNVTPLPPPARKLIILSVDGFPAYYSEDESILNLMPNFRKLMKKANFSNKVRSVYPTLTYPSHTSMITGLDPSAHGITSNRPIDPFEKKTDGAWYWYKEDIKVPTLWDYAKKNGLKTGSVYWPVSVGAEINYNIPQYWRYKNEEDIKLLKALSSPGLYKMVQERTGIDVAEYTGDTEKMRAGIEIWKSKQPDLLFIYTTDIDSAHHYNGGVYSKTAKQKISKIDELIGLLIDEINLYKKKNIGLIIISDHGFKKYNAICYPNNILRRMGHIVLRKKQWNYYFRSHGGMATLVKNDGDDLVNGNIIDMRVLQRRVKQSCPGVVFTSKGKLFDRVKKKLSPETEGVLYTTKSVIFSRSIYNSVTFNSHVYPGSHHGFLPFDDDMYTIGLMYPPFTKRPMRKVTDVFYYACNWLKINCRKEM